MYTNKISYISIYSVYMILLIIFSIFLSYVFYWVGISEKQYDCTHLKTEYIVSLDKENEISGSFLLGFGSINSEYVYYGYFEIGKNKYKLISISTDAEIIEIEKGRPRFVSGLKCRKYGKYKYVRKYVKEIFVPKGTIIKKFDL